MAEVNAGRITAVLAADTNLQVGVARLAALVPHLHELTDAWVVCSTNTDMAKSLSAADTKRNSEVTYE